MINYFPRYNTQLIKCLLTYERNTSLSTQTSFSITYLHSNNLQFVLSNINILPQPVNQGKSIPIDVGQALSCKLRSDMNSSCKMTIRCRTFEAIWINMEVVPNLDQVCDTYFVGLSVLCHSPSLISWTPVSIPRLDFIFIVFFHQFFVHVPSRQHVCWELNKSRFPH